MFSKVAISGDIGLIINYTKDIVHRPIDADEFTTKIKLGLFYLFSL